MADTISIPTQLGDVLRQRRLQAGLSKKELALRAGKVREVIYRLEAGEDVTVSSLLAVLGALGLALQIDTAGLPTQAQMAALFAADDEDGGDLLPPSGHAA